MPPHELDFNMGLHAIEDPILVVGQLSQFFSQTLTILNLTECNNVPLPLFLVRPKLKKVHLDGVEVGEESYDKYPDEQYSDREPPALERGVSVHIMLSLSSISFPFSSASKLLAAAVPGVCVPEGPRYQAIHPEWIRNRS